MQINCPCCDKKIGLLKILLHKTTQLYRYPCPHCQQKIQTPWGVIVAFKFTVLFFMGFIFIKIFTQNSNLIEISTLFGVMLFIIVLTPVAIRFLPFHCNTSKSTIILVGDEKITLIERNMNERLFHNFLLILKILLVIMLLSLAFSYLFNSLFSEYLKFLFAIILIGFASKKLITDLYISHFWNKIIAKIIDCKIIYQIDKTYQDHNSYILEFTYKYEINQKYYQSKNRLYDNNAEKLFSSIDEATKELKRYLDNGIPICYSFRDASKSYIDVSLGKKYRVLYMVLFGLGLALLLI